MIETVLWYLDEIFLLVARAAMIVQGFRDETFGMPLVALMLHLAWDFWFSWSVDDVYFMDQVAFFLDLIILFQVVVYGPKEFFMGERWPLYGLVAACLVLALGFTKAVIEEEGRSWSHSQLWYCYMFITSVLFVPMLLSRNNARGQNMIVATCRGATLICAWVYHHPAVVGWLCMGALAVDVVYIYLLYLCLEKPQEFYEWRNYLVASSENSNVNQNAVLMMNHQNPNNVLMSRNNKGIIYHAPPMVNEGGNNNNNVEMAGGVPS